MSTSVSKPLQIRYYKTNVGNFFTINPSTSYYGSTTLKGHNIVEINGIDVSNLLPHRGGWYLLDTELKDFKKKIPSSSVQTGWKLKNLKLVSDELPENLDLNQIKRTWDDDDNPYIGSHADYHALYEPVYENSPERLESLDVELTLIQEIDVGDYSKPAEMKITLREGEYGGKTHIADLSNIASLSEIEALLTPEFMQHTRPCSLSSEQVYKIVREHILQNIDGNVSRVNSNYNFCFGVVKKVQTKPYKVQKESYTRSGNSYKPPRFVGREVSTKEVTIFEMTWWGADKGKGYASYPVIEGWKADNLQELYDNMQRYLQEIMEVINSPAKECPHCNGTGYECSTIETNQQ